MNKLQLAERLKYNRQIINKLSEIIEKHPYLRFGQILVDTNIIELIPDRPHGDSMVGIDPFYEESKITLEKILKSNL